MARIMLKSTNFSIHWYRRALLGLMALGLVACGGGGGGGGGVVLDESDDETVGDEVSSYSVTPSAGEGGSISPATAQTVNHGATTSFTLTPAENYSIDTVSGCDGSLEGNTYITGEITADCSVQASFVLLTAPQNLAATAGHQVHLAWTAVTQAAEYCVYVSDSPGINRSTADSYDTTLSACTGDTDTLYTIPNLTHGTRYYFVVTTKDGMGGESAISAEVSAISVGSPLSDTGINGCANADANNLDCPVVDYPGQDGEHGRDTNSRLIKIGAGQAGFDFTKVCNSGELAGEGNCPVNPALGSAENEWACTLDNHTGMMWEMKVNNNASLHHMAHTFTWFNSDVDTNGGSSGTEYGADTCNGTVTDTLPDALPEGIHGCDTEKFVIAVNTVGLCGHNDWRLPARNALTSLVNSGISYPGPTIDTDYFPNTSSSHYWSSTTSPQFPEIVNIVDFGYGSTYSKSKDLDIHLVRLVRAGQ